MISNRALEIIRCTNVSKRFGSTLAVDAMSFGLQRGEVLALLGPSGCGKTTALRLLAGFERADTGSIQIGGQLVADERTHMPPERRHVGMVFQNYALFPHLDIQANIGYGLERRSERTRRVAEVIELVGLGGLERRMPHELSGGQQQRVALARALAPQPEVVLLDEPFSNLDAALRHRVRLHVQAILSFVQATAVFVTHDQAEAMSIADKLAVMQAGRIVQLGSPPQVYRLPQTREVAAFLGAANWLPGEADGTRVQCVLGTFALASPIHGAVEVLLRPEGIELTPVAEGVAKVVKRDFLGHEQLVTVGLSDGTALHVRHHPYADLAIGQQVALTIRQPVVAFALTNK